MWCSKYIECLWQSSRNFSTSRCIIATQKWRRYCFIRSAPCVSMYRFCHSSSFQKKGMHNMLFFFYTPHNMLPLSLLIHWMTSINIHRRFPQLCTFMPRVQTDWLSKFSEENHFYIDILRNWEITLVSLYLKCSFSLMIWRKKSLAKPWVPLTLHSTDAFLVFVLGYSISPRKLV